MSAQQTRIALRQTILPAIIAPVLAITGYRFDKSYRQAESGLTALIFAIVSTPIANAKANEYREPAD